MKRCSLGRVHSFESFGTHEGPGIRYVVFMQGCLARCLYCQNPDTWPIKAGQMMTAKEVFKKIEKALPYIRASSGGVTVSGGEPLLQLDFLIELFKACKKKSIHTALDTSGFIFLNRNPEKINEIIKLTDLFIVDIKAADFKLHKRLTARDLNEAIDFINMLEQKKKYYWLRYVLVPGLNDSQTHLGQLKDLLAGLKYCKKFEILPYHTLGKHKWQHLGLRYALKDTPPATSKDIKKFWGRSMPL